MPWFEATEEYFGTQIYVCGDSANDLTSAIWQEAERLEQKFSRFKPDSALSQFNQDLNTWHSIDAEWIALLSVAESLKVLTGVLDITVHSTLESWGYDSSYSLQEHSTNPCLGQVELDILNNRFRASAPIDFGSFGKGYFLDRVCSILAGSDNFFINAGGDLYAQGVDKNSEPWKIFFEDPRNKKRVIGSTEVDKWFACSSSPLQRQWRDRHHLVDPKKLLPAEGMKAVYVQSNESGAWCDGLSTALFVMGFEAAKKLATEEKLAVMLLDPKGEVWRSDQFQGQLFT